MQNRGEMRVVKVERMGEHAIDESGARGRKAIQRPEYRRFLRSALALTDA